MKVRALANISGPYGSKEIGDEFVITAEQYKDLEPTGWVEEVKETKSAARTEKDSDAAAAKA